MSLTRLFSFVLAFDVLGLLASSDSFGHALASGTAINAPFPFVAVQAVIVLTATRYRAAAAALALLCVVSVFSGFSDGSYAADLAAGERFIQLGIVASTTPERPRRRPRARRHARACPHPRRPPAGGSRGRRRLRGDRGAAAAMTSVVLADDQELVRSGFRLILELAGIEIHGEAGDGRAALELARATQPDVVLMDIRMPVMDGIEATRRIAQAGLPSRVLVLTTFDLDEYVFEALRAGASGFLLKDAGRERLVEAVRTVAAGESLFAPTVLQRLVAHFVHRPPPGAARLDGPLAELSEREAEVLRLVGRGLSNAEIAAALVISQATVKTHVRHVLQKLGLRDRVQAVALAYEAGLL